jgi:hypothetical protein
MKYARVSIFIRRFYLNQEEKFTKDRFDTRKKDQKLKLKLKLKKEKKKEVMLAFNLQVGGVVLLKNT